MDHFSSLHFRFMFAFFSEYKFAYRELSLSEEG